MKSGAEIVAQAKLSLGNERMSDRELGERIGYSQQAIADAKHSKMTDPVAIKLASVLNVEPGELIYIARTERERDPVVRWHLERWGRTVGKALASASSTTVRGVAALTMALGLLWPSHDAHADDWRRGRGLSPA